VLIRLRQHHRHPISNATLFPHLPEFLQLIGLWVIGGGGVDTERSPHFNYSHQLLRKSNHEFSDTLLNQLFQEQ
jgi:hypothetical protein